MKLMQVPPAEHWSGVASLDLQPIIDSHRSPRILRHFPLPFDTMQASLTQWSDAAHVSSAFLLLSS